MPLPTPPRIEDEWQHWHKQSEANKAVRYRVATLCVPGGINYIPGSVTNRRASDA